MRAVVAAAAAVARENQVVSQIALTPVEVWGAPDVPDDFDHESAFTVEVVNTHNTYTNICDVCFSVEVTTGPTQLREVNMAYKTKAQAIQNLHYCVGHIAPERLQHLMENGQCFQTCELRQGPTSMSLLCVGQGLAIQFHKAYYYP